MKIGVDEDLVSIITCVYNGQRFLEEALSSALCQSYENVEVIVVNDCSTDQSEDVIHGFSGDHRMRYVRNTKNLGLAKSRNIAMELCRGRWVTFLDQDDRYRRDRVERFLNRAARTEGASFIFSDASLLDERGERCGSFTSRFPFLACRDRVAGADGWLIRKGNFIATVASFIKKELCDRVGRFDERFNYACDYDFYMRCGRLTDVLYVPETLSDWRMHPGQQTKLDGKRYLETRAVMAKNFRFEYLLSPSFVARYCSTFVLPVLKR